MKQTKGFCVRWKIELEVVDEVNAQDLIDYPQIVPYSKDEVKETIESCDLNSLRLTRIVKITKI